jgi:hypothetical protein
MRSAALVIASRRLFARAALNPSPRKDKTMNEPQSSPPASAAGTPPETPKKKVSPLVWVAIGCVGLIVVGGIITFATGAFLFKKFEKNPAMAAAEMVVKMHPDVELVDSDADAGTLTIRDKKTGEVMTVDMKEVEKGNLKFKKGDEESTISIGGGSDGQGSLSITGNDGKTTFRAGAGASNLPDWVPIYPGTSPTGSYQASTGEGTSGAFALSTKDSAKEVLAFYGKALDEMGAPVQRQTYSAADTEGGIVTGGSADEDRKLNVTATQHDGETVITVTYTEKG